MSRFRVQVRRGGVLVEDVYSRHNTATVEGLAAMQAVVYKIQGSPVVPVDWYICPSVSGTVGLGDTMAANSLVEFTDYTVDLGAPDAVVRSLMTRHNTPAGTPGFLEQTSKDFGVNNGFLLVTAAGNITGMFLTSGDTKGTSTGELWAGAPLFAPLSLSINDELTITYELTVQASDSFGTE